MNKKRERKNEKRKKKEKQNKETNGEALKKKADKKNEKNKLVQIVYLFFHIRLPLHINIIISAKDFVSA